MPCILVGNSFAEVSEPEIVSFFFERFLDIALFVVRSPAFVAIEITQV